MTSPEILVATKPQGQRADHDSGVLNQRARLALDRGAMGGPSLLGARTNQHVETGLAQRSFSQPPPAGYLCQYPWAVMGSGPGGGTGRGPDADAQGGEIGPIDAGVPAVAE